MYGAQTGWLPIPSTLGEYCSMMILPFLGNMCWKKNCNKPRNLAASILLGLFVLLVVLLHVKHTFGPHRVEFMQINCWAISLMLCMDQILVGHFDLTFRPFMEWLLSFRRFLPDVTSHAMIKKMSVLPLTQEPLRTILPRQQRQLWLGTRLHLRLQHVWNLQSSPLFNKLIPGD